jgi:hypothetical protein
VTKIDSSDATKDDAGKHMRALICLVFFVLSFKTTTTFRNAATYALYEDHELILKFSHFLLATKYYQPVHQATNGAFRGFFTNYSSLLVTTFFFCTSGL